MIKGIKPLKPVVIAGAQFGALTVFGKQDNLFLCVCECGNEVLVNPDYLLNGTVTVCDNEKYNVFEHMKYFNGMTGNN